MGSDQSKSLDKTIFDMRLTTKQLMRMSKKAEASKKHEEKEVAKVSLLQSVTEAMSQDTGTENRPPRNCKNSRRKCHQAQNVVVELLAAVFTHRRSRAEVTVGTGNEKAYTTNVQSCTGNACNTGEYEPRKGGFSARPRCSECSYPEQINTIMEKFEKLSEDLEVTEAAMTDGVGAATASGAPIDEIDELMNRVADEQNIEMAQDLPAASKYSGACGQLQDFISLQVNLPQFQ